MTKEQEKERLPAQWAGETLEKPEEKTLREPQGERKQKRDEYVVEWAL